MKRLTFIPFFRNNRALSYTVSAMLITGTTIVLVLVASIYAYQILERQKGLSEFEVAQKSILAFNDSLENVAWKLQASRSSRFTIEYGELRLSPAPPNEYLIISAAVGDSTLQLSNSTYGRIQYIISDKYTTFYEGYSSYILGNSSNVIVGSAGSYGRAIIQQQSSLVSINLDYRVRAMRTSVMNVGGKDVNYVDVWVITTKMRVTQPWSYIHDFDLKARCVSITTDTYGPVLVNGNTNAVISVKIGGTTTTGDVPLVSQTPLNEVVFNVVVSEIEVYV